MLELETISIIGVVNWRIKMADKIYGYTSYNPSTKDGLNRINMVLGYLSGIISGQSNGSGTIATDANVEKAVQWGEEIINSYSYPYIWGAPSYFNDSGVYSGFDCSGFVCAAFYHAGFGVSRWWTGTMRSGFTGLGFKWYSWSSINDASNLRRGDILLNEQKHTGIWTGSQVAEFTGGSPGGGLHTLYWWGGTWDGILRYESSSS